MSVTEYIAAFAEYFTMLINMIKDFFASLTGGNSGDGEGDASSQA